MDRNSATEQGRTDDARDPQQIPDFLIEAAESTPQHVDGAEDAEVAPEPMTDGPDPEHPEQASTTPGQSGETAPEGANGSAAGWNGARGDDSAADAYQGSDAYPQPDAYPPDDAYAQPDAYPEQPDGRRPMDPAAYEAGMAEAAEAGTSAGAPYGAMRSPYVRQRTPHKTQPAIDDDSLEGAYASDTYAHDSNVTIRGGVLSGGHTYRRARSAQSSIQQGRYGRYLEVPKGRRSIFASRERARRRRSLIATIVVILVFVVIVIVIAQLATHLG